MSTPTHLVLPSIEASSTPSPELNLLPFHTPFSGPAPVSTYFLPRSTPDTRESALRGSTLLLSAFRGRQLVGQKLEVPAGYEGVVLSVPEKKRAVKRDQQEEEEGGGRRRELVKREQVEEEQEEAKEAGEGGRRVSPRKRKAVDKFGGASFKKPAPSGKFTKKFRIDSDSEEEDDPQPPQPSTTSTMSATPPTSIPTALSPLPTLTETSISSSSTTSTPLPTTSTSTTTITSPPLSPPLQLINDTASRSPSPTPLSPNSQPLPIPHHQSQQHIEEMEEEDLLLPPPPARELKIVSTFGTEGIVLWSADDPVDEGRDEYYRCLGKGGWMELAEVLHQEEVEEGEEE